MYFIMNNEKKIKKLKKKILGGGADQKTKMADFEPENTENLSYLPESLIFVFPGAQKAY